MNNTIYIDVKHQVFWLSYKYLSKYDILEDTITKWCIRKTCHRKYIDGRAYINYDTIPEPSRKKLPDKAGIAEEWKRLQYSGWENLFFERLEKACSHIRVGYWRNQIINAYPTLGDKALEFAVCASVFEKVVKIHNTYSPDTFSALFHAYNRAFPCREYKRKTNFSMAIAKAKREGIMSVAVDLRAFKKSEIQYKEDYQALALSLLTDRRGLCIMDCYDLFTEGCKRLKYDKIPSYQWFRKFYKKNKPIIDPDRVGKTAYQRKHGLYAKIIAALNAGDQWQMDGWTLPFYCKKPNEKGGWEYFVRYILFAVMDAHSRKIIGYDVAESENTETILAGLEMAVCNTKTLPFELVADNHSFNKTKESDSLKQATGNLGMKWTVDSNPRRKAILERAFRTLGDKHFKLYRGYLGQGIKSKIETGRTQQELIDEYSKPANMLTFEQVCIMVEEVIEEYNGKVKKSLGESPDQRFAKSVQPNSIPVDDFTRLQMFIRVSEHKVTHGQITITRGMHTYEYQLPAKYSNDYNGKTVGVRYPDFETIYLYNLETDEHICSVDRKYEIHGAAANQTKADTEKLFKNGRRIKGINSRKNKKTESIYDESATINPNVAETANALKMPKEVLQKANRENDMRRFFAGKDAEPEAVPAVPAIKGATKLNDNKSPFSVKNNEIRKVTIEELAKAGNFHQSD